MNGLRKNEKNLHFLGFWASFGQNGQSGNFFKNALGTFFSRLQALTNSKVSGKQARDARSLGKFPKYCNNKKSEKQICYPKRYFPIVKFFQAFLRGLRGIRGD